LRGPPPGRGRGVLGLPFQGGEGMAMKVLLFEYITGGGCRDRELPTTLAQEGELMLQALGAGLCAVAGVRLTTLRDARLPAPAFETELLRVGAGDDCGAMLDRALADTDAFWPVAPETGGLLAGLCRRAEERACLLLNSPARVVEQTGSKYRAAQCLREAAVPCVETARLRDCRFPQKRRLVLKPDDGTDCEGARLLPAGALPDRDARSRRDYLCQPYLEGVAASLSVIYSPAAAPCLVGVNRQEVALERGRFRLRACHVNALAGATLDCAEIAAGVQRAFPGLVGYVGIDAITDGAALTVLEVNPRATTSFAGLARSTDWNPCAGVLRAASGEAPGVPPLRNRAAIEVRCDGG